MKVLFVYLDVNSSGLPSLGLGVASLSGYLKKHGVETSLCYIRDKEDTEYLFDQIKTWKPDLLAVSSTSSPFPYAKNIMKRARKLFPDLYIVCGGSHVSIFPEEIEKTKEIDAICLGYGEEALHELVCSLEKGKLDTTIPNFYFRVDGQVIKNHQRPFPKTLDNIYIDDREIFYNEYIRKNLQDRLESTTPGEFIFVRSCPYRCSFCSSQNLNQLGEGRFLVYPSIDLAIENIKSNLKLRPFDSIVFHDDIFFLGKKWFREFLSRYKAEINLPYAANLRIGNFNEDDIKLMKQSNCTSVIVGIESGNEYIRNKVLNKQSKNSGIIVEGFKLLRKIGIKTASQNLIGVPEENFSRFYDTVKINAEVFPVWPVMSVYHPYPGTSLYEKVIREKLFSEHNEEDSEFVEREKSVLRLPGWPREQIEFYAKYFRIMVVMEVVFQRLPILGSLLRKFTYDILPFFVQKFVLKFSNMIMLGLWQFFKLLSRRK